MSSVGMAAGGTGSADLDAPRASWGLSLLILLALYTAMDRQVLGLLAGPLRRDLGITDLQFGLLQGTGVALFTAFASYPLAWIADRSDRRHVLALCMIVWCAALAGCAAVSDFSALFIVSSLMGAAEAGVIPIAYAQIADWFGCRHRQGATSVFVLLGRLGAGVMIAASGWLVASVDQLKPWLPLVWQDAAEWRLALMLTAVPGLLIVPMLLTMPRARQASPVLAGRAMVGGGAGDGAGVPVLPALLQMVLGAALLAGGAAAVSVFMPVLMQRMGMLAPGQIGGSLGAAALLAALAALAISTGLAWRDPQRAASGTGLRVAASGMVAAAVAGGLLVIVTTPAQALMLYGCALGGTMTAVMLLVGVLQAHSPPGGRTRFMAVFVGAAAIAGALSPVLVGAWSDANGATPSALASAMATLGAPCFAGAALALLLAAKRIQSAGQLTRS